VEDGSGGPCGQLGVGRRRLCPVQDGSGVGFWSEAAVPRAGRIRGWVSVGGGCAPCKTAEGALAAS
jgi:hypothetical protein